MEYTTVISKLTKTLLQSASKERGIQQTKYLKGVVTCYGLTNPQNREIFKVFFKENLQDFSDNDLRGIGYTLLHCKGFDEKFHGIACLGKTVKSYTVEELHKLEPVIDNDVYDWATCDNLSNQVIKNILLKHPESIDVIRSWKSAPSWRQRAACVSLLHFARRNLYTSTILEICDTAIHNPFRFTQLGVGWVLRDVSVHNSKLVIDFLNSHEEYFTREAVRYATEKMNQTQKSQVNLLKNAKKTSKRERKEAKTSSTSDKESTKSEPSSKRTRNTKNTKSLKSSNESMKSSKSSPKSSNSSPKSSNSSPKSSNSSPKSSKSSPKSSNSSPKSSNRSSKSSKSIESSSEFSAFTEDSEDSEV